MPVQDCYLAFYLTEVAGSVAMVFTRTCESTRRLALMLRNLGFGAVPIHGQMSQPKRIGALNKFKGGERSLLIATGALPCFQKLMRSPKQIRSDPQQIRTCECAWT